MKVIKTSSLKPPLSVEYEPSAWLSDFESVREAAEFELIPNLTRFVQSSEREFLTRVLNGSS